MRPARLAQAEISRRRFLHGAAATTLVGLTGCDWNTAGAGHYLRFWNGFTGPDGRAMLRLVQAFNEQTGDLQVSMQRIDWNIYYNKLLVAGLDGRAPDIFVSHASVMMRLADGGFISSVDDLLGETVDFDRDDFDPRVLEAVERNGQLWGIPLDVHPIGMYYNRTLFRNAGLVDSAGQPQPPTDRDSFVAALRALKKTGKSAQDSHWGYALTWLRTNLYTLVRQWGGDIFAPDGIEVVLDSDANAEAFGFIVDLIHQEELVLPPLDIGGFSGFTGFRQGRVGMVFDGIYMLGELQKQTDVDWAPAPMPQLGPYPAAWADSHVLCIPADLPPQRRAAAARFVRFLSDHALEWSAAGQVPVRRSQRAREAFAELPAQSAFAERLEHVAYLPRVPYVLEYQSIFDVLCERVLRARDTPAVCLRDSADELRRVVERYQARSTPV